MISVFFVFRKFSIVLKQQNVREEENFYNGARARICVIYIADPPSHGLSTALHSCLHSCHLSLQTQSVFRTQQYIGVELHSEESSVTFSRFIGVELDSEGFTVSTCTERECI